MLTENLKNNQKESVKKLDFELGTEKVNRERPMAVFDRKTMPKRSWTLK